MMIGTKEFAALIDANAVKSVKITGVDNGFTISVDDKLIEAKRGHTRIFRKLQTAAVFLKNYGIGNFTVDLSRWNPEQTAIN